MKLMLGAHCLNNRLHYISMVSFKIVGVHARNSMIYEMKKKLPNCEVIYDERIGGGYAFPILKKTWAAHYDPNETHRVVLNDDLELCDGFTDICQQIALMHPDKIVCLFSTNYNDPKYDEALNSLTTPYIYHDHALFGCAIMMPKAIANECMEYTQKYHPDVKFESHAFLEFARKKGIHIITTIPCLVQHIGDVSLIEKSLPIRQSTRYIEQPNVNWLNTDIAHIQFNI